jgi:hypothetical protein
MKWYEIGEKCLIRSFMNFDTYPNEITIIKSRDEIGRSCSTYVREQKCIQGLVGKVGKKNYLGRRRCR